MYSSSRNVRECEERNRQFYVTERKHCLGGHGRLGNSQSRWGKCQRINHIGRDRREERETGVCRRGRRWLRQANLEMREK